MNCNKESVIRMQWLTEGKVIVYDVHHENGIPTNWELVDSYAPPVLIDLKDVEEQEDLISISLPYNCNNVDCGDLLNHTLQCLIQRILELSPKRRLHIEKISSQLSKLDEIFYEMPAWELHRNIRNAVQQNGSAVMLEDEHCYLELESSVITSQLSLKEEESVSRQSSESDLESSEQNSSKQEDQLQPERGYTEITCEKYINQIILECFKESNKGFMTTPEITSKIKRKNALLKARLVYDALLNNGKTFRRCMNHNSHGWRLQNKKFQKYTTKTCWKPRIIQVLKGHCLTSTEVCNKLSEKFPEVTKYDSWKLKVRKSLSRNEVFTKLVKSSGLILWSVDDDDDQDDGDD